VVILAQTPAELELGSTSDEELSTNAEELSANEEELSANAEELSVNEEELSANEELLLLKSGPLRDSLSQATTAKAASDVTAKPHNI
jgi:hypothetical protein